MGHYEIVVLDINPSALSSVEEFIISQLAQ
jgi:hypothetical protein